jgi:hypothetical protein
MRRRKQLHDRIDFREGEVMEVIPMGEPIRYLLTLWGAMRHVPGGELLLTDGHFEQFHVDGRFGAYTHEAIKDLRNG